jgi:hypothetical protein
MIKTLLALFVLSSSVHASRYFDGIDDYVRFSTMSARGVDLLYFTSHTFTLSVWIKPVVTTGEHPILSKITDDVSSGYELYLDQNAGRIYFDAFVTGMYARTYGTAAISTSAWTHIAVIRSTFSTRILRNAVDVTSVDAVAGIPIFYTQIPRTLVGTDPWGGYFRGYIAEISVCGCIHTADEIRSLMHVRRFSFGEYKAITFLERTTASLFCYWPFDSPTIDLDYSGQGHNVQTIAGTTVSLDHPPIKALRR